MSVKDRSQVPRKNGLFSKLFGRFNKSQLYKYSDKEFEEYLWKHIYTPLPAAIAEIKIRRNNLHLENVIASFLKNDIPAHFKGAKPLLYLSRHIATPNFETLKFIERTKLHNDFTIVIGEDIRGKFASVNKTKRALGKLPIVKGMNRMQDEIVEHYTIINFDKADGKAFSDILLLNNTDLVETHHKLLQEIYPDVLFVDESSWIDRHFRSNLREQYKHMLALTLMHGIMFETYYPNDKEFVIKILIPTIKFLKKNFGFKPLICKLSGENMDIPEETDMVSYPSVVYPFIDRMVRE